MRRLKDERGFAVPVLVAVLAVVGLLAAGAAAAALGTNEGANEDRRSKRALAAAEAGIQQAAYRLANVRPATTACLSPVPSTPGATIPAVAGECPTPVPGSVAADASFSYHVTTALPTGAVCADVPTIPAPDGASTDHCITAVGTVGNVKRRLQARARIARGGPFTSVGLIGLDYVYMYNSDVIKSDIGSNGLIDGDNSVSITGKLQVPNSAPTPTISGSNPAVERRSTPWELFPADFAPVAAPGGNNNGNLANLGGWNANTKVLAYGNSAEFTLTPGTYWMCEFFMGNSVKIHLHSNATPTNPVRLYIDSPSRPGSGCAEGTGRFCLDNSVEFNKDGNAGDLEVYVYGSPAWCSTGIPPNIQFDGAHFPSNTAVVLGNSVLFGGTISAPNTAVRLNNSIKLSGGVHGKSVDLGNSVEFTHSNDVKNKVPPVGPVKRLSWVECQVEPTTVGDPESGCT